MKNVLKVNPNERVDISDFRFAARDALVDSFSELSNQFLCNPGVYEKSVLSGFNMTNPSGDQVQVTRGRAILHQRYNGTVVKSILTTAGDTSKTVDISAYPDATYGIYIRFEAPPGEPEGRVFWNPTGAGSEYTQTMETRYVANWSLRIEVSTPGEEWLQIGTVIKPGMSITDQRDMYFEGVVSSGYTSGWSTEGGGSSTDRDTDRSTYGIGDLHTFVAAVRQCLTDIKGRGIRDWYSKGIGGINVGFDDDPIEGHLAVGDDAFYMQLSGNLSVINFGTGANFRYSRTNKDYYWNSSSATTLILSETALYPDGLGLGTTGSHWASFYVGSTNTYGARYLSCCEDDTSPDFTNQVEDTINMLSASLIYTDGYSGAHLSRKKETYVKDTGTPQTARKQLLVEGIQAITEIDHSTTPGVTLENSIKIGSGAAIISGQDAFIYGASGGAIELTDLWDGSSSGGLTTETKTYLTSTTNGYDNCLWLYIWLRKDGTFWLEPFGPEIKSGYVWTEGGGRYSPRTESGLPQSGFDKIDYLLVDVCWLVYGKAKTSGTASDVINLSGAIYGGNGYRHIEKADYSDSTAIEPLVYFTDTGFTTPLVLSLNNVDTTDKYKRSPGIPIVSRKARIAISGQVYMTAAASCTLRVGDISDESTVLYNTDYISPPSAFSNTPASFSFIQINTTGGNFTYTFSGIVDIDIFHVLNGTTDLYEQQFISRFGYTGTAALGMNISLLGFYWNRQERDILSFSTY